MVELLFHECEQQTSCATRENRFHLEEEISNFGRRLELEQIPLFINDTELDSLMIKAVQGKISNLSKVCGQVNRIFGHLSHLFLRQYFWKIRTESRKQASRYPENLDQSETGTVLSVDL